MLPFSFIFTAKMKSFGLSGIYYSLKIGLRFFPDVVSGMMLIPSWEHTGPMLSSRILLSASGKANLTENDGTSLMLP